MNIIRNMCMKTKYLKNKSNYTNNHSLLFIKLCYYILFSFAAY